MTSLYSLITQLTSSALPDADRIIILNDFAYHFGWTPSDSLDTSTISDFANANLVVEHGLENTAVITFLRKRYSELGLEQRRRLLNISYNNLVDWHFQIEVDQILYVFNRSDPPRIVATYRISRDEVEHLRSKAFEQISGKKQNSNLPALDDALIDTISLWKRSLSLEMENGVSNEELSALFNSIIFVRAIEDHYRRMYYASAEQSLPSQALLEVSKGVDKGQLKIRDIIFKTLERFGQTDIPNYLIDETLLRAFDHLQDQTILDLFSDFYRIKNVRPYEYDFSVMSKHALSRIYERYTNLLKIVKTEQAQGVLFQPLPEEEPNKALGSIYTPQFIARFFARYLREQMPPFAFKRLRPLEPAIGSGIFLRTLLELQCDPTQGGITTEVIQTAFENIIGLDRDPNACHAAQLSLSLLHLVLTNSLPSELSIYAAEAVTYYQSHPELRESRDVVIANPPFVSWSDLTPTMRDRVMEFMNTDASGRVDLYLAFLKIALEVLKPGGYGLFVLPHNFLLGKNALNMRKLIAETSWIRCLADLSLVPVFEDKGAYIILLIFQKRFNVEPEPKATIVKCRELVGSALQNAVEGRQVDTSYYSVFNVPQSSFTTGNWIFSKPTETSINNKLEILPPLDNFLHIHKGIITGKDKVFIVPAEEVPRGVERKIFAPFLSDKEMSSYIVPENTKRYVFYPYINGRKIEEDELKVKFPKTWQYLISHKPELEARPAVVKGSLLWWQPERPRSPEQIIRPKIVTPHLVVMPRFALDLRGKYVVTQAPIMYPKSILVENDSNDFLEFIEDDNESSEETTFEEAGGENDLLRYFVAVLNSSICYQYISEHSHRYGGGYSKLEPRILGKTPVPDPAQVPSSTMRRVLTLVDQRLVASGDRIITLEVELDGIINDLYGLNMQERLYLGGNTSYEN